MAYFDTKKPQFQPIGGLRSAAPVSSTYGVGGRPDNKPGLVGGASGGQAPQLPPKTMQQVQDEAVRTQEDEARQRQAAQQTQALQLQQAQTQTTAQGPNVQSPFLPGSPGTTQPAYEQQAMEALRQQGQQKSQESGQTFQTSLAAQQAAAEQALQQGGFAGQGGLLAQQGQQDLGMLNRRAELGEQAWQNRFNTLTGPGGVGAPPIVTPGAGGPGVEGNETAARAAAFARAKEQSGRTANAALASLRGLFEDRGTTGSTMEAARMGQVVGGAGAGVNEFTRDQLMSDLARQAELTDMQYQGGIQQRGQNIGLQQALLGLMNSGGGTLY